MTGRDNHDVERYTEFALALAQASAAAIIPHFRNALDVDSKGSGPFDPVTIADRDGEATMRALIEDHFPDHGIIGEEYGPKDSRSGYSWILDPIDGTKSFIIGFPAWATLIGLTFEGQPILGLMSQPYVDEIFVGARDLGSRLIRKSEVTPLAVSQTRHLRDAKVGTIGPERYRTHDQQRALQAVSDGARMLRYGGDAYFYCLLSSGNLDVAMDAGLAPYDIVPLIPIVEGAGGHIGTWGGETAVGGGNIIAAATQELFEAGRAALCQPAI